MCGFIFFFLSIHAQARVGGVDQSWARVAWGNKVAITPEMAQPTVSAAHHPGVIVSVKTGDKWGDVNFFSIFNNIRAVMPNGEQ